MPVAMRERTQIEEEPTEESPFDISDAEEQLLLDMTRDIESRAFPIQNNSHTSFHPQETAQDSSSYNSLDQD